MSTITVDEVARDLLGCIGRVKAGETLVITQAEQPIAELKPIAAAEKRRRPSGLCAGQFRVPDDFDSPLPDDVLRQFEGT